MSDLYADLRETAGELIAEFGKPATIRRTTGGSIDPVTGIETAPVTTDYPANVLENSPNSTVLFASSLIEGSLVSEADRFFLVAADERPRATDSLIVGGATLAIQGVRALEPGATAVYYEVRARG